MDPKILSCGIIPLKKSSDGEWLYLLLRCYRYWDFPKGQTEAGESAWEVALRELSEETGITGVKKSWGVRFQETEVYGRGKRARYYLGEVEDGAEVILSLEHHEFRWLPFDKARSLLGPRLQKVIDWAQAQISSS